MTQKTVHDVCTKMVWKADDVHKTAAAIRQYKERLGYSEQWMTDYVYNIVLLAKKEPKRKDDDTETKKAEVQNPRFLYHINLYAFLTFNATYFFVSVCRRSLKRLCMA